MINWKVAVKMIRIVLFVFLTLFAGIHSKQCYYCKRSINAGCDFKQVDDQVGLTTVSCDNECYTELTTSVGSSDYKIVRGCFISPVCTNTSYSVGAATKITKCCDSEKCNYDITNDVFQCYECADTDGETSTCKKTSYRGSVTGSFHTTYCTKYCEKRIKTEGSVVTVTRSCQDSCAKSSKGTGISTEIHCCQGDLCNNATYFRFTTVELFGLSFCGLVIAMAFSCQL